MKKNDNSLLLDRILEPVSASLNEEAALKLIAIKADRKLQARVTKLAEKCTEGKLTPEERHEYEIYISWPITSSPFSKQRRILLAARKGQPA